MGVLTVSIAGSFGVHRSKIFGAMNIGHAAAIAQAIQYLSEVELPLAIKNDHECQRDGIEPSEGFGGLGKLT